MSLLDFKNRVSKNELLRRNRIDMMTTGLLQGSVNANTCVCGHWAIRHIKLFGSSCSECACIHFHAHNEGKPKGKIIKTLERFISAFYRKDNAKAS